MKFNLSRRVCPGAFTSCEDDPRSRRALLSVASTCLAFLFCFGLIGCAEEYYGANPNRGGYYATGSPAYRSYNRYPYYPYSGYARSPYGYPYGYGGNGYGYRG
ncbi:MAG TPA: hypothetical protein VGQ82_06200, partial [Chthoniobacterales bacterium]|nr:hypothetical protein [Chthoniobacterales bacterium]